MNNVLIVGGGPAGASAALGFLRAGFDVTLIEQRPHWQGRVCGAFLDAEAVRHLRWLNLFSAVIAGGALKVPTSVITTARGTKVRMSTEQDNDAGWGYPRHKLEEILLNSVLQQGGSVKTGTRMLSYRREGEHWIVDARGNGGQISFKARHLVLAGGRFAHESISTQKHKSGWFGWNAVFQGAAQEPGEMSLHFYPGGYVGVLTFRDGTTNVCGLKYMRTAEHAGWDKVFREAMQAQPGLRELLEKSRRASEWRGVGPLPFGRRNLSDSGPILAGDAAAVGEPFMGEGIGRALGAGPMIYQTLLKTGFDAPDIIFHKEYARLWKKSYAARFRLGFWMRQALGPWPLSEKALEFLMGKPALLSRMTPFWHQGFASNASKETPRPSRFPLGK